MNARELAEKHGVSHTLIYNMAKKLGRLPTDEEVENRKRKTVRPLKYRISKMMTENSCYNCPNRREACHDNCEVYKAWKAEYQRKEKEETKTRKAYYNYVYYRSKD